MKKQATDLKKILTKSTSYPLKADYPKYQDSMVKNKTKQDKKKTLEKNVAKVLSDTSVVVHTFNPSTQEAEAGESL